MSHDEILEAWNGDRGGEYVQINDDRSVVYVAHGCVVETIVARGARAARQVFSGRGVGSFDEVDYELNDKGFFEKYGSGWSRTVSFPTFGP